MSCLFCDIVAAPEHSSVVYEDETILAFCDIYPVNPGHVLVIPKAHAVGLADLDGTDGQQMFRVAQEIAGAIRRTDLRCDGGEAVSRRSGGGRRDRPRGRRPVPA